MRFEQLLNDEARTQLNKMRKPAGTKRKSKKRKVPVSFSAAEMRDLMGTNRQTYKRVSGRVRGK